ncbi:MAG: YihY/virulence factor BrkB family protein [Hamadaea sp.]|nr:YihY/virulence factor BrkB family protein [Hamadaea sp.]NUR51163.1 YihY/virulence factor BrkB family protein [Hamadaea sp.]NUT02829.1 YihY/virulence factor BrkB family protein [Hamadaea sp.]
MGITTGMAPKTPRSTEPGRLHRDRLLRLLKRAPRRPADLGFRAWVRVFRRTVAEFVSDDLGDMAAALTYYGILSIFPGLLVLVAGVGLLGDSTATAVETNIRELTPGPAQQIIADSIDNLRESRQTAGVLAVAGLVIAFWSATGYIGSFMRAANRIFDVPEGRPFWKTVPVQLAITAVTGLFLAASALAVVFTGRLAAQTGKALGFEEASVRVFDVVKWPALILGVTMMLALLYWASPNARQGGFRWITPGSLLAVVLWIVVSAGFAFYVAHFGSYNKTYGTLGGVIVFLVWLWLTNVAVLLGAEFDAELGRARAIAAGLPPRAEPYLPLRDVPKQHELQELTDDHLNEANPSD